MKFVSTTLTQTFFGAAVIAAQRRDICGDVRRGVLDLRIHGLARPVGSRAQYTEYAGAIGIQTLSGKTMRWIRRRTRRSDKTA